MPNINWTKKLAYEGNVAIPGGERWSRTYDLALFEDLSDSQALVLLVTVIMDFSFKDDDGGSWTETEKTTFMNDIKTECEKAWSEKFRILLGMCIDPGPGAPRTLARVVILIKTAEDMAPFTCHWTITAHKMKAAVQNLVRNKSDVRFESTGLKPKTPTGGSKPRRSIVHEFGHMLGYRDEYPNSGRGTDAYPNDSDSMMHFGETVRDRHYVFFADWISNKLESPWLVEGRRNLANTPL